MYVLQSKQTFLTQQEILFLLWTLAYDAIYLIQLVHLFQKNNIIWLPDGWVLVWRCARILLKCLLK